MRGLIGHLERLRTLRRSVGEGFGRERHIEADVAKSRVVDQLDPIRTGPRDPAPDDAIAVEEQLHRVRHIAPGFDLDNVHPVAAITLLPQIARPGPLSSGLLHSEDVDALIEKELDLEDHEEVNTLIRVVKWLLHVGPSSMHEVDVLAVGGSDVVHLARCVRDVCILRPHQAQHAAAVPRSCAGQPVRARVGDIHIGRYAIRAQHPSSSRCKERVGLLVRQRDSAMEHDQGRNRHPGYPFEHTSLLTAPPLVRDSPPLAHITKSAISAETRATS